MNKPTELQFTDFQVSTDSLFQRAFQGPMNLQWTRVQFPLPDGWDANVKVQQWITANITGRWAAYHYADPKSKNQEHVMVVRFEQKDDALMFKLRGGHQAWQTS